MSNSSDPINQTTFALRRLTQRFDGTGEQINDFLRRQAHGEPVDPQQFMKLMELRSHAQQAMQAQFKLHEKPLKTVLNETR